MGLKYGANFLTIEAQTNAIVGELEDICGQLGDIEGEWQKTAEEAIQRIQKMIEGCMGENLVKVWKKKKRSEEKKDPKIDVVMGEEIKE